MAVNERTEQCDVLVVGGGSAAFESAISARQAGAERVIMLEKAPEPEFGGNARRYCEAGLVIHPAGGIEGGLGQLMQWRQIALRMGIDLRYESRVTALHGNHLRIEGAQVTNPDETYNIRSHAVILCAGGFQ